MSKIVKIYNATYDKVIADAVHTGLSSDPKFLPSWLFYDERGDKIFQSIMEMPSYYPTRCEFEILEENKVDLAQRFKNSGDYFELIELGAGDGRKTEILLRELLTIQANFSYIPVDVSPSVLTFLEERLRLTLPELDITPRQGTYAQLFDSRSPHRKVLLFLGGNIGNYTKVEASELLANISDYMQPNDLLLVGFDLKKDPRLIQQAYDDTEGITRDFNLNLLHRCNQELDADFKVEQFSHFPLYDPSTGEAKSFLVSQCDQEVFIKALNTSYHFKAWETIYTEISLKVNEQEIIDLANSNRLEIMTKFSDTRSFFMNVMFSKSAG